MCIVVLDELDQACKQAEVFVKDLFLLPKKQGSRLIVIGIANRMDLAERMLKGSAVTTAGGPIMLPFHSYGARQLLELLKVLPSSCH
jgi:Cdc6-like AAA superfamily ATPase